MLVKNETVYDFLKEKCEEQLSDRESITKCMKFLYDNYDIPLDYSSDLLTLRRGCEGEPIEILYCFVKMFDPKRIDRYFSDVEKRNGEKFKFKVKKIRFPLRFKAVQIDSDQWVTGSSAKSLMKLRDAQLLYYNEKTQRSLKHVKNGNIEYWAVDVRMSTVEQILELLNTDNYIPNFITLNIPEDSIFSYNEEEMELCINSLSHFDILDGYHRYIALSTACNLNRQFDYPIGLRLVCFSEGKAQECIYQENKQTKLKKIDADALNQNNLSGRIVEKLNFDRRFDLYGKISRNKGIIDFGSLVKLVAFFYETKKIPKRQEGSYVIKIENELRDKINCIVEDNPKLIGEKQWSYRILYSAIYSCRKADFADISDMFDKVYSIVKTSDYKHITKSKPLRKVDVTRIDNERQVSTNVQ